MAFVHPFDDPDIVAGQGTLGLELLEDVPALARIVVPVGGGGLASGIAIAVKSERPEVEVIGVQVDTAGSREIATRVDLDTYDFAFPAGIPAAERIRRERKITAFYQPFYTPMAVGTFKPIARLLSATASGWSRTPPRATRWSTAWRPCSSARGSRSTPRRGRSRTT